MIYLDHNATSPLRPSVKARMIETIEHYHANASSAHSQGLKCRDAIESARRVLADVLKVDTTELIFTASASESNLMTIWGLWLSQQKLRPKAKKILTSPVEHSSVYENLKFLEKEFGAEVVFLKLTDKGLIDLHHLKSLLNAESVAFVTCIGAQNEVGIIQPWKEMASLCADAQIPFHVDLVQCFLREPLDLSASKASAITLCFHKAGGPKGVGLLYLRGGVPFEPLIRGGSQEKKRRAGTENIVAILGAGALAEEAKLLYERFGSYVKSVREGFERDLVNQVPGVRIVGADSPRLCNTSFVLFDGQRSDLLLMKLDLAGICVSTGSACASGMVIPSRALMNLGYSETEATSGIRFSFGPENTPQDAQKVIEVLSQSLSKARAQA